MSDLVGNPEDPFSRVTAHTMFGIKGSIGAAYRAYKIKYSFCLNILNISNFRGFESKIYQKETQVILKGLIGSFQQSTIIQITTHLETLIKHFKYSVSHI